jgi:hypothetical protein
LKLIPEPSFEAGYPNISAWIAQDGWIDLGYEPNTAMRARALNEGRRLGARRAFRTGFQARRLPDEREVSCQSFL